MKKKMTNEGYLEQYVNQDNYTDAYSLIESHLIDKADSVLFKNHIKTFEKTETERRLTPVQGKNYNKSLLKLRINFFDLIDQLVDQSWLRSERLNEISEYENPQEKKILPNDFLQELESDEKDFKKLIKEQSRPFRIFVSYSHRDRKAIDMLKSSFSGMTQHNLIEIWYDGELLPGEEWEPKIFAKLNTADFVFLLISQYFIESFFCIKRELPEIITRHNNDDDPMKVIPIYLKNGDYKGFEFGKLQWIPKEKKYLDKYKPKINGWNQTAIEFRKLIDP